MIEKVYTVKNVSLEGNKIRLILFEEEKAPKHSLDEALSKIKTLRIEKEDLDDINTYIKKVTESTMKAMKELGMVPVTVGTFISINLVLNMKDYEKIGRPTVGEKVKIKIEKVSISPV